jgi:hypothetical protein
LRTEGNARRSRTPKSWGWAIPDRSQSARKYGAQAEPPKSLVLVHLKYILGFMPYAGDLIYPTPKLAAAMHLVACEARLDQVHAHCVKVQDTHRDEDFDNLMDCVKDPLYFVRLNFCEVQEALSRILKMEKFSTCAANREKKIANRYLSEAWSKRGCALEAYLEI